MKQTYLTIAAVLILGTAAFAQPETPPPPQPPAAAEPPGEPQAPTTPAPPRDRRDPERMNLLRAPGPPPMRGGEPMAALQGPQGRWWGNPELVQKLSITADQQKKMDDILQQHRLRLVDLHAAVQKQELLLEPLVSADQPDETRILAQIDRVAQARAELEKANARMLLDIRRVLTPEQWQKLKTETPRPPRPAAVR